jgi:hypothetical protein
MNTQSSGKPIIPSFHAKQAVLGTNDPVLNPDPLTDNVPEAEVLKPDAPISEAINHETPISTNTGSSMALFDLEESEHLRSRWIEIQGKFVDEPRAAVKQADALVSEAVEKITQMFASEHDSLEGQWNQGMDLSTEDLRKALQHYRSFFNRLVA